MFDGTLPSTHQVSCINRLLFEAQALSISDMKSRVEPQVDAAVRKIPAAERIARQEAQKSPETTPSHGIADRLVDMLETGVLQYLEPNKFISRAQEIQSRKAPSQLIPRDG